MDGNPRQMTTNAARMINYRMHAEQLFVPVLNDFEIKNDANPQVVLLAEGHGFVEQLTSDGHIDDGQFEQRIDLVINNTKQFMKKMAAKMLIRVLSTTKITIMVLFFSRCMFAT